MDGFLKIPCRGVLVGTHGFHEGMPAGHHHGYMSEDQSAYGRIKDETRTSKLLVGYAVGSSLRLGVLLYSEWAGLLSDYS